METREEKLVKINQLYQREVYLRKYLAELSSTFNRTVLDIVSTRKEMQAIEEERHLMEKSLKSVKKIKTYGNGRGSRKQAIGQLINNLTAEERQALLAALQSDSD